MKQCKCEHWQQCPVCMPHRFDANGALLPPEPTPLEALEELCAEFRALDLPYGSKAYAKAMAVLKAAKENQ